MSCPARWRTNFEVDHKTGCWLWCGALDEGGYGQIFFEVVGESGKRKKKTRYAHVVFWEEENGVVTEGYELHHRCEVHRCVNPSHLKPVTHRDHRIIHGNEKLTSELVVAMRKDRRSGMTYRALGLKYGVHEAHAKDVCDGLYWKHVEMPEDGKIF